MGTNFYWLNGDHIGKRSAAGMWCEACDRTLCLDGPEQVHYSRRWAEVCPSCGKKPVDNACSFTYAQEPLEVGVFLGRNRKVRDEYGRRMTGGQFLNELNGCRIKFTDSIGKEFS